MSKKLGNDGLRLVFRIPKNLLCLAVALVLCVLMLTGCKSWDQPGETLAEGSRRHERVKKINRQEMAEDLDYLFLTDQPSKLTDKRIP